MLYAYYTISDTETKALYCSEHRGSFLMKVLKCILTLMTAFQLSGLSRPIHLRNAVVANTPLQAMFSGSLNIFLAAFARFCWYAIYKFQYTYT